MKSLFSGLITSKTRVRIIMRLFHNPKQYAYLRELSDEFGLAPSQVREELKQLNSAGLLSNKKNGRQILYSANTDHPLFPELHSMVRKALGMDRILESIISRLGDLEKVYLIDDYAEGKDTGLIDLVLVGRIDQANLADLVTKTERYIGRKIRTLVLTSEEYQGTQRFLKKRPQLLLWERGD
ncbi:MAG TPA: ArsR family transcriptional regulator [candidate division WOR-3 bacterium]|uniref:ArsR family transcriptional regulator n=1 Tax=candidate division WOR-3 bacterium TaxID=2052148 RepID=A0A7C5M4I5_UNCW3|nr:ArsR family transcriptional regulator [candidate division WOR-3 bacterium]